MSNNNNKPDAASALMSAGCGTSLLVFIVLPVLGLLLLLGPIGWLIAAGIVLLVIGGIGSGASNSDN